MRRPAPIYDTFNLPMSPNPPIRPASNVSMSPPVPPHTTSPVLGAGGGGVGGTKPVGLQMGDPLSGVGAGVAAFAGSVKMPALDPPPRFNGVGKLGVSAWLKQVVQYVNYYSAFSAALSDVQKVNVAIALFDGIVLDWWSDFISNNAIRSWEHFIFVMKQRWETGVDEDTAAAELMNMKQGGGEMVQSYSNRFMNVLTRIPSMDPGMRKRLYIKGLRTAVAQQMYMSMPADLDAAMKRAEEIELALSMGHSAERVESRRIGGGGGGGNRGQTVNNTEVAAAGSGGVGGSGGAGEVALAAARLSRPPARPTPRAPFNSGEQRCYRCGENGHIGRECPYGVNVCYQCKKPDCSWATCPQRKKNQPNRPTPTTQPNPSNPSNAPGGAQTK